MNFRVRVIIYDARSLSTTSKIVLEVLILCFDNKAVVFIMIAVYTYCVICIGCLLEMYITTYSFLHKYWKAGWNGPMT